MQLGRYPTATTRVRSFEAALKVLGPEEQAIRAGRPRFLCNAPRRKRRSPLCNRSSSSPDSVVAAHEKVAKLEKVLSGAQGTSCDTRETFGKTDS